MKECSNNNYGRCSFTGILCKPDNCDKYVEYPFPVHQDENGRLDAYEAEGIKVENEPIVREWGNEAVVAYYKNGQWVSSKTTNHYSLAAVINENSDLVEAMEDGWIRVSVFRDFSIIIESIERPSREVCKIICRKVYGMGVALSMSHVVHASAYNGSSKDDKFYDLGELL